MRRAGLVISTTLAICLVASAGGAAALPAPGVITGGVLNRCEDFAWYSPGPWTTASASFKFTGRIIHNGAAFTVTRGHATLDIVCAFSQYSWSNAHLVMTANTPTGSVTIDCRGNYIEGGEVLGLTAGVPLPNGLDGLASSFGGFCDPPDPATKTSYIDVQFVLLGPDRDPSPTEEAFTIVGAYVMQSTCKRQPCPH